MLITLLRNSVSELQSFCLLYVIISSHPYLLYEVAKVLVWGLFGAGNQTQDFAHAREALALPVPQVHS